MVQSADNFPTHMMFIVTSFDLNKSSYILTNTITTQSIGKNVRGLQWCNWRSIFYFFLSISFFLAFYFLVCAVSHPVATSKGIGMHQTSSEASQSWSHSGELRRSEGKGKMYNMTSYMNIYYIALCATHVLNPRDPEPRCQVWSAEVQSAGLRGFWSQSQRTRNH